MSARHCKTLTMQVRPGGVGRGDEAGRLMLGARRASAVQADFRSLRAMPTTQVLFSFMAGDSVELRSHQVDDVPRWSTGRLIPSIRRAPPQGARVGGRDQLTAGLN